MSEFIFNQIQQYKELDSVVPKVNAAAARISFLDKGFPSPKDEEWVNTPLQQFLKAEFQLEVASSQNTVDATSARRLLDQHLTAIKAQLNDAEQVAYRIVMVNNQLSKELSSLPATAHVIVKPFEACSAEELVQVNTIVNSELEMVQLNNAFLTNGLFIKVAPNTVLEKPLHIIHISQYAQPTFYNSRVWFHAAKNSQVELIETYTGNDHATFANAVIEFNLEANAQLKHYDIQKAYKGYRQVKRTEVKQVDGSVYSDYVFNLPGGDFFRNNLALHLDTPNQETNLFGLYLTSDTQLVDNHTEVHHKHPHCNSNQLYKGILLDDSRAVFNGKIFVYEQAQKTNAFQQSNNILFSENATINAKPQLEIFADDVKCSHGTTIGQLDAQALFYLKSRGISEKTAKRMLANAFAFDVAERVEHEGLRNYLESEIATAIA